MKGFSISKNLLIVILAATLASLGIYVWKDKSDHSEERPITLETFDPGFDMIDPENPLTKVDQIISLRKKSKELTEENIVCQKMIAATIDSKNSVGNYAAPKEFLNKDGSLTTNALDYINSYYRLPVFNDIYTISQKTDSTSVMIIEESNHFRNDLNAVIASANILFAGTLPNGNYNFQKADYSFPIMPERLQQQQVKTQEYLITLSKKLTDRIDLIKVLQKKNIDQYNKKVKEYKDSRFDMSGKAISWGIIAFVLTAIVLYISGMYFRDRWRSRLDERQAASNHYDDLKASAWNSVYLITVLLLIITIFVLGLARLLTENTLAALLGGIAGYVLNNKQTDIASGSTNFRAPVNDVTITSGGGETIAPQKKDDDKTQKDVKGDTSTLEGKPEEPKTK